MDNKPVLPEGWAMPDDLARKVSEALNKKSITPQDELADGLMRWRAILPCSNQIRLIGDGGWLTYWSRWRRRP
jgi:hypothetical protein